jgi:hypothetical protein
MAFAKKRIRPLSQRIIQDTGIAPEHVDIIECIMREEVFHSTLDWQTAEQLRDGALEALRLFASDRDYYLAWTAYKRLFSRVLRCESDLRKAQAQGDAMRIKVLGSTLDGLRAMESLARAPFVPIANQAD